MCIPTKKYLYLLDIHTYANIYTISSCLIKVSFQKNIEKGHYNEEHNVLSLRCSNYAIKRDNIIKCSLHYAGLTEVRSSLTNWALHHVLQVVLAGLVGAPGARGPGVGPAQAGGELGHQLAGAARALRLLGWVGGTVHFRLPTCARY